MPQQEIQIIVEPQLRRSERENKGIPPQRLAYSAHTIINSVPESWSETQKLSVEENENMVADIMIKPQTELEFKKFPKRKRRKLTIS